MWQIDGRDRLILLLILSDHSLLQTPELVHKLLVFLLSAGQRWISFSVITGNITGPVEMLSVVAVEDVTSCLGLDSALNSLL